METKDQKLTAIEKRLRSLNKSLLTQNHLNLVEQEAEYLMKGFATELIEKVYILDENRSMAYAKVYGVIAKDQSFGRYVWIYLFYDEHLYKCRDIKSVYDLIDVLKEVNQLKREVVRINKRLIVKEKLLQISTN